MLIRQLMTRVNGYTETPASGPEITAPGPEIITSGATVPVAQARLVGAKRSYSTARADFERAAYLITGGVRPRSGDLVLARVAQLGQHKRIELPSGRRAFMFADDEIIVCYGARYASDQFHSRVPDNLGPCQLVAAGGIASECLDRHDRMKRPTEIIPIGLIADRDRVALNLSQFALEGKPTDIKRPPTIAVLGTSMNAGKTTTAANLIRGMSLTGLRVGAIKATGTGAGGDRWLMTDSGAALVLDFTDAGHPSTYGLAPAELENVLTVLATETRNAGVDAIVIEIADGLLQADTAHLVGSPLFKELVDGIMLAAGDSMGAAAAVDWLDRCPVPILGVSGLLTASPLATREAARTLSVPVIDAASIHSGAWLPQDRMNAA